MTYKTRQEVLRAAADWIDACEAAGVKAVCKMRGVERSLYELNFNDSPDQYEFPLALLEGKEVWVGSELWNVPNNFKFTVKYAGAPENYLGRKTLWGGVIGGWLDDLSWNPPKPATVMVELSVNDAEFFAKQNSIGIYSIGIYENMFAACKKALEKL